MIPENIVMRSERMQMYQVRKGVFYFIDFRVKIMATYLVFPSFR